MPKRRGPTPSKVWQPMKRGVNYMSAEKIESIKTVLGREPVDGEDFDKEVWLNDKYVVHVRRDDDGFVMSLSIRRADRGWPRDWRDFQRIKNEIAGPEIEAVELYPAESRLVDTANQFWLWCAPPGESLPIGFTEGRITTDSEDAEPYGAKQRELS